MRLPPVFLALLLQTLGVMLGIATVAVLRVPLPPLVVALLCGVYAAGLSHLAGQARWWLWIQLIFTPALILMLALNASSNLYLAAFVLLALVYWSTFRTQVPLYLSSKKVWQALETQLPPTPFRFIDLGSGLGGVLDHLSHTRSDGHFTGIESAPLPCLLSWLRLKLRCPARCAVHWGDFWDADLGEYDVVFAYLSPVPMARLWEKVRAEMKPGSLFISSTFVVPDQEPQARIEVEDLHRSTLLVWSM